MNQISRNSDYSREIVSIYMSQECRKKELISALYSTSDLYSSLEHRDDENKSLLSRDHTFNIYLFEKRNEGIKASTYTSVLMHYAVRYEPIENIDFFFNILDKKSLTSWSLIALLRTTYTYRKRIAHWERLYNFTVSKVEEEGLNVRRELYGLDA